MKYGFIGCGNMGSSLVRALHKSTTDIAVADFSEKSKEFAKELGILHTDNESIVKNCDRVFLAVKPHILASCLAPLQPPPKIEKTMNEGRLWASLRLPIVPDRYPQRKYKRGSTIMPPTEASVLTASDSHPLTSPAMPPSRSP